MTTTKKETSMTTTTETTVMYIDYRPNSFLTRYPCGICGGHTEKQDPMAEASTDEGARLFAVCDDCAGHAADPWVSQARTADSLRCRVAKLRRHADELEALAQAKWVFRTPVF